MHQCRRTDASLFDDLRERALLDSDAGMKAADVAVKYRVSGSWVRLLKQRRRRWAKVATARPAARAAPDVRAAPAHPGRADRGATGSHLSRAEGRARPRRPVWRTIWRAVAALDVTVKKTVRPSEHDRPDVAAARVVWHAAAPTWDPTRLVFLDETGITNNLLRRYGRALRGARVHEPRAVRPDRQTQYVSRSAAGDWRSTAHGVYRRAPSRSASFLDLYRTDPLCPP